MGIIDINTKKMRKLMQALIDNSFIYLKMYNEGTPFQKTTSKKRLVKSIEEIHEFLEGSGKLIKIKPPKKITSYSTGTKTVHIINKI